MLTIEELLLDIVKKNLQSNEKEALGSLSLSQEMLIADDLSLFTEHSENTQSLAKNFFEDYYRAIQVVDCCLNRDQILTYLKSATDSLSKLEKSLEKDMKALCSLKRFALKLQETTTFIEKDASSPLELFNQFKDKIIELKSNSNPNKIKVHRLSLFEIMPGAKNLLNYQLNKILEVNKLFIEALNKLVTENQIQEILIDSVNQEELDEFLKTVKGEKLLALGLLERLEKEANVNSAYNQVNLNSIGSEFAFNLLYRLAWRANLRLSPAVLSTSQE